MICSPLTLNEHLEFMNRDHVCILRHYCTVMTSGSVRIPLRDNTLSERIQLQRCSFNGGRSNNKDHDNPCTHHFVQGSYYLHETVNISLRKFMYIGGISAQNESSDASITCLSSEEESFSIDTVGNNGTDVITMVISHISFKDCSGGLRFHGNSQSHEHEAVRRRGRIKADNGKRTVSTLQDSRQRMSPSTTPTDGIQEYSSKSILIISSVTFSGRFPRDVGQSIIAREAMLDMSSTIFNDVLGVRIAQGRLECRECTFADSSAAIEATEVAMVLDDCFCDACGAGVRAKNSTIISEGFKGRRNDALFDVNETSLVVSNTVGLRMQIAISATQSVVNVTGLFLWQCVIGVNNDASVLHALDATLGAVTHGFLLYHGTSAVVDNCFVYGGRAIAVYSSMGASAVKLHVVNFESEAEVALTWTGSGMFRSSFCTESYCETHDDS